MENDSPPHVQVGVRSRPDWQRPVQPQDFLGASVETDHDETQRAILSRLEKLEALVRSNENRSSRSVQALIDNRQHEDTAKSSVLSGDVMRAIRSSDLRSTDLFSLLPELPTFAVARGLVNHFFAFLNPIRYPIDESWFWGSFNAVYSLQSSYMSSGEGEHEQASADIRRAVKSLPLVFIVLASSCMTAPNENAEGDDRKRANWGASLKLYWIGMYWKRGLLI